MNLFLSCDWGTSSFRLSLVNAENFSLLESHSSGKGILGIYNDWNETGEKSAEKRISFYLEFIKEHITAIEKRSGRSLEGTPLLISGMASSSIGIKQLPYQQLPLPLDGSGMLTEYINTTSDFKNDILLISGARTNDDVMRGEETQLIGLFDGALGTKGEQLYILPGTHSKHILVVNKQAVSFKTYMTGEFFDLLSKKSILHAGIEETRELESGNTENSFIRGVEEGSKSNLMHACFKVRTNSLFDKLSKKENYHYLSGLLIGAELGEITDNEAIEIYLCSGAHLKTQYETALVVLGLKERLHLFSVEAVENAALVGQFKIYEKHSKR
jgi:2-dehydro-3-deoxygalactonokinase